MCVCVCRELHDVTMMKCCEEIRQERIEKKEGKIYTFCR